MLKKQNVLLLELLIAFSLFCLCIIPLIETPFKAYAAEIKSCQRMQLQRLADLSFVEVEAQLFENTIPWKDLTCVQKEKNQLFQDKQTIHLKRIGNKEFERTCSIWTSRRKEGKNQEEYRLLTIELRYKALNDKKFFFKKKNSSNETVFLRKVFVTRVLSKTDTPQQPQKEQTQQPIAPK